MEFKNNAGSTVLLTLGLALIALTSACSPVRFDQTKSDGDAQKPSGCVSNCGTGSPSGGNPGGGNPSGTTPGGGNPGGGSPSGGVTGGLEETLYIQRSGKIDILFVIDNSPSMIPEQQEMGNRFQTFVNSLSGLDWQIVMTTTDANTGFPLRDFQGNGKILKPSMSNPAGLFSQTVQMTTGSGDERGIYVAREVLSRNEGGWIRAGSSVAVVLVSDEDSRSYGDRNLRGETITISPAMEAVDRASNFVNFLGSDSILKLKKVSFHSIVIRPPSYGDAQVSYVSGAFGGPVTSCLDTQRNQNISSGDTSYSGTGWYGAEYALASSQTGGVIGSVCESNYDSQLVSIGQNVQLSDDSVTLGCVPSTNPSVEIFGSAPSGCTVKAQLNGYKVSFVCEQTGAAAGLPSGTKVIVKYPSCK